MAQYIDKSALVAEIKRIIKHSEMVADHNTQITELVSRELDTLYHLISFLDTLEVKKVDYGIEVHKYAQEHFNVYDDVNKTLQTKENKTLLGRKDFEDIAKHFFELGLKTQKGE